MRDYPGNSRVPHPRPEVAGYPRGMRT